jgi:hypothetical protein
VGLAEAEDVVEAEVLRRHCGEYYTSR